MPIIEIRNLTYVYHPKTIYEKKALDNISFTVEKGEFLGIVGTNGSGKSTLIQHFNGLLSPESGSISVFGRDTRDKDYRDQLWKKVGLVFQFPEQQLFEATVFDELAFGLKNMGLAGEEIERRVDEALESVGLDPQLGFLHAVRPGRAALALDLMEEFRAILADRLALTLINRGQITSNDFAEREGGAVLMEGDARKTVVVAYQERKQEEVMHPLLEAKVPIGLLPLLQARFMARTLRGEMEGYLPFLYR